MTFVKTNQDKISPKKDDHMHCTSHAIPESLLRDIVRRDSRKELCGGIQGRDCVEGFWEGIMWQDSGKKLQILNSSSHNPFPESFLSKILL